MAQKQLINFNMQIQEQDNWCWAATAASTDQFYPNPGLTQCAVASQLFNLDCCQDPGSCNIPYYLEQALQAIAAGLVVEEVEADAE